ncbi:MAG: 6-carboxytetrahydropterin synthase QueD [Candidatus Tritonobacter lacicola]|nr:6-carboxytetrahydropterin synthase QueD [Candidatus Tritonobacter lacicola]
MEFLVTKEFEFDASHFISGRGGKCERLHGHTWRFAVTLEAELQEDGIAFDFRDLAKIVEEGVVERLDHTHLNDLLDQPSAENLAVWIWAKLEELPLHEIRVWESGTSSVTFRGPKKGPKKGIDIGPGRI